MFALLVKPAVFESKRFAPLVHDWVKAGAVVLSGHNSTELRAEVTDLVNESQDPVTVVACGGDGTVHLLANAVVGLDVTFAVVPMGTGNDFARHVGLTKANHAIAVAHDGERRMIDVGEIQLPDESRYFVGIASCGFDAQVNERANTYRGPQGTVKYVIALLAELRALTSLRLRVDADGNSGTHDVTLLAIGNTSSYGGGMLVCPTADAEDAQFEVMRVAQVNRRTLLRVFPRVFKGTHVTHPAVTMSRASRVELSGDEFPIYADGERVGRGPATIRILPGHLAVLHPKESS